MSRRVRAPLPIPVLPRTEFETRQAQYLDRLRQYIDSIEVSPDIPLIVDIPSSTSDSGERGQIAFDEDHLYICVDTNTWRRVAISTW